MTNKATETGWKLDNSYARLPEKFFSKVELKPVSAPKLVKLNHSLAKSLGLNAEALQSEEGVAVFAGNEAPEGSLPIAQAYAGHQFGNFTMLGDGRALLFGEQITSQDERYDIQLKGSGRTPYSRGGDGRAALGPMLREYIISEAMHALGIPTTRSLAVVTTGESIVRETELPGAILTRVAASHLRVGTFQYGANWGTAEELRSLADYAIKRHYPHIEASEDRYLSLLQEVIERQAALIAKWQLVGFIHGVMNTDNMTISGETIDYGPCAFMDTYDPATVFSSIDLQGRYAYGNQPIIGGWNLARFAESLLPLLHEDEEQSVEIAQKAIEGYMGLYQSNWLAGMRAKLGLFNEEAEDEALIEELFRLMHKHRADYTNTFRVLTTGQLQGMDMCNTKEFDTWHKRWQERLDRQEGSKASSEQLMRDNNPAVIPRNHRVEEALEAAVERDDFSVMERLLAVLSDPYAYSPEQEEYAALPEPPDRPYRTYCGT
ncbi:protein adenylyltransferase SelO [Bacillus thermotolerans]|uniref:Protein nucleotidyltransferase YdiU n=1 Tax=Bacillus thermotolerans TaxID=1221996 RepID=A0A0F5HNM9_BACTR|nr:YdiU family protein [Bacillus thermotolerans]KKB34911.1 Selenoprotein O and cysteine-containing protein [Bacillus thermotolerans]KKB40000.1 Selenoprotein O and cysteine-containing protein [Bacillus thermotolerans]KKB43110.1 Selenoprotein O and cysteine-containing protein [Bacillus thermotolerans]